MFLLLSPENENSKKTYQFHPKNYLKYVEEKGRDDLLEEPIINYFSGTYQNVKYGPAQFWCSYILAKSKVNINVYSLLREEITGLYVKHLKKKADIVTASELGLVLHEMFNDNNPKQVVKRQQLPICFMIFWAIYYIAM